MFHLANNFPLQNLAVELSSVPKVEIVSPTSLMRDKSPSVPLLAHVYLKLGTWNWELSRGLDDESIKGSRYLLVHVVKIPWAIL